MTNRYPSTMPGAPNKDRRVFARARIDATAMVWVRDVCWGSYVIENLSRGGAYLSGGRSIREGCDVRMLLHLPGGSVNAAARVLRSEAQPRDAAIAVRFDELSSLSSAAIDAAIAEGFQRAAWDSSARPEPNALVVGQPLYLRETLVNELRSLGLEAAPMPTPLDALVFLERPASRVRVVIAIHSRHTNGRELLSFLAETRPETLRVLLSESKRSLTGSHPESAPAHAVLTKPWDLRTLVRSMTTNP